MRVFEGAAPRARGEIQSVSGVFSRRQRVQGGAGHATLVSCAMLTLIVAPTCCLHVERPLHYGSAGRSSALRAARSPLLETQLSHVTLRLKGGGEWSSLGLVQCWCGMWHHTFMHASIHAYMYTCIRARILPCFHTSILPYIMYTCT